MRISRGSWIMCLVFALPLAVVVDDAAENGNVKAQMFLAIQWDSGSVVPRNETKAEKWYRLAAENGNVYAKKWLEKKGK